MTDKFTRTQLRGNGFEGWITFDALRRTDPCPEVGGVYVVARDEASAPSFLAASCGGWFKDRDPTVSLDELQANWVEGAEIVYIGKANNIRRRLKEFAKFGAGQKIGHWGGRLIWQLEESSRLLIAWKPSFDNTVAVWKFKDGELELKQIGSRIDNTDFQFFSRVNRAEAKPPVVNF